MKLIALFLMLIFAMPCKAANVESPELNIHLDTKKIAHVTDEVDMLSLLKFQAELESTKDIPGDRVILINSPGGSVQAGEEFIAAIRAEQATGTKVVCVGREWVASMAFNILTACDVRLAYPSARLLFHKAALGSLPEDVRITAKNLKELAKLLDEADEPYCVANSKALGMTREEYDFYADHNTYWTADVLRKLGYLQGFAEFQE